MADIEHPLGRSDDPRVWNPPEPEAGADLQDARVRCESCDILRDQLRGAVSLIEDAISGVENLPMQDAIEYLRGEWLTAARQLGGR